MKLFNTFLLFICVNFLVFQPTQSQAQSDSTGYLKIEGWFGIGGNGINNLLDDPRYPDSPDTTNLINSFQGPVNIDNDYGTRVTGYITPLVSGDYEFWVSGDDQTELHLSTDENPSNINLIANVPTWSSLNEWDKFPEQHSQIILLEAGQSYYVELLHKEGAGGDQFSVAWSGPGINQEIISSEYISVNPFPETETTSTSDLIIDLSLDGNANDASGNNNHGVVNGAVLTTGKDGASNTAYQFDGSDDDIMVPDDPSLDVDYVTLSAWVYLDDYNNDQRIISREQELAPHYIASLVMTGPEEKNPQFRLALDNIQKMFTSNSEVPLNTWTHLAATYDGNHMKIYINGELDAVQAESGTINHTDFPIYIGHSIKYFRRFQGKVDEVKIYNRALSDSEVMALYGGPSSLYLQSPSNLSANIIDNSIELSWTDNSDGEEGFIIEKWEIYGSNMKSDTINANLTTYLDNEVFPGETYGYKIKAYNSENHSEYSNEISLVVPGASSDYTLYELEDNYTIINDTENDGSVGKYSSSINSNGAALKLFDEGDIASTTFSIAEPGTYQLRFSVRSGGASGSTSLVPEGYIFGLVDVGEVPFTFNESTNDGPFDAYGTAYFGMMEAEINFSSAGINEIQIEAGKSWVAVDFLEVIKVNSLEIPSAPTNLTAKENTETIELSWEDNSDNEEGFIIEKMVDESNFTILDTLSSDTTSYLDSVLVQESNYTYRIQAFNAAGNSNYSNEVTVDSSSPINDLIVDITFSGNSNDASGNDNDGVVNGAILTNDRNGIENNAYQFDGIDDNIMIPDDPSLDVDYITMSGWIYLDNYTNDPRIISRERTTDPKYLYSLFLSGTGDKNPKFRLVIDSVLHEMTSTTEVPLNTWTHLAATYDGTTMRLYVNGELDLEEAVSGTIDDTDFPLYIGHSLNYDRHFPGKIDDIKLYNRALTIVEVRNLYQLGSSLPEVPELSLELLNSDSVALSWNSVSNNPDGYLIERSINGTPYSFLDSLAAGDTLYYDTEVSAGTQYSYRIQSFNELGASGYSNTESIVISENADLVLSMSFSGNANDASGNNIHGTNNGALLTSDRYGNESNAFYFDGADDDVMIPDNTLLDVDNITISTWINPKSYQNDQRIISREQDVAPNYIYSLLLTGAEEKNPQFRLVVNGTQQLLTSSVEVPLHSWTHLAATYDGTSMKIYVNAELVDQKNIVGTIDESDFPIYIGHSLNYDRHFHGKIDDLKIYGVPLSASEISDLYQSESGGGLVNPTNLTATLTSSSKVLLNWEDNADNESGYFIERKIGETAFELLDSVDTDIQTYVDENTISNQTYTYRINAYSGNQVSIFSNEVIISVPNSDLINVDSTGVLIGQLWNNILGGDLSNLTSSSRFPNSPDSIYLSDALKGPVDFADNYGQRIYGYITPQETGDYEFWVAADDQVNLYLSLDSDESNKELIVSLTSWSSNEEWNKYPEQKSTPIYLEADVSYYVELVHKEGGGGDHVSVAWTGPNGATQQIIGSEYISTKPIFSQTDSIHPPTNLQAVLDSNNHVAVSWIHESDHETGYVLERNENNTGFQYLDSLAANSTFYLDSLVGSGSTYQYRIYAHNESIASEFSDSVDIMISEDTIPGTDLLVDMSFLGNASDASGNENNGAITGATLTTGHTGESNSAYQFDGDDDYISIDPDPSLDPDYITLSAWIYLDSYRNDQRIIIKERSESPSYPYGILMQGPEDKNLQLRLAVNGVHRAHLSEAEIPLETWTHVAATFDGTDMSIYINGAFDSKLTIPIGTIDASSSPVYIGNRPSLSRDFHGKIDEVKIYGRALSATEIEDMFLEDFTAPPPPLLSLTGSSQGSVVMEWTALTGVDGFVLEKNINRGTFEFLDSLDENTYTFTDNDINQLTEYGYRVKAYNGQGESEYSNEEIVWIPGTSDLMLDLAFDGNIDDASEVGHTGSLNGATLTEDRFGNTSRAYAFDGNDEITIDTHSGLNTDYLTISTWVNLSNEDSDSRIIGKETGLTPTSYSLMTEGDNNRNLEFWVGVAGHTQWLMSTTELSLDTWHHVAATYDGSEMRIYINGVLDATKSISGVIFHSEGPVHISYSPYESNGYFTGKLDEIKLYNRALNETEIQDIYSQNRPTAPSDLTATLNSSNHIELTWTDNSDNEEGFILERNENNAGFQYLDSLAADTTSYVDSLVNQGSSYQYRIHAFNVSGASEYNAINDSIFIEPPVSLSTPQDFLVYSLSESKIKIQWTDASGGQDAFEIHRDDDGDGIADEVLNISLGISEVIDSLLTDSVTYAYKVRAINGVNTSEFTEVKDAMTYFQGLVPDYEEYLALKALYDSTNGDGWTNNTNWLNGNSSEEFKEWYNVYLENNDIASLRLYNNNLTGKLPSQISNLSRLKYLYLSTNNLRGPLPLELFQMSELKILSLSNNDLNCRLSKEIGQLIKLEDVHLNNCNFIGNIPKELFLLTNLNRVYLDNNDFEGNIPSEINKAHTLYDLRLNNNNLIGQIPDSLFLLNDLQHINISFNRLNGKIPENFKSNYPINIDLSNNKLTGSVPRNLINISSLSTLYLDNNLLDFFPLLRNHESHERLNIKIENNLITFKDIEQNLTSSSVHPFGLFTYTPQRPVLVQSLTPVFTNATLTLSSNIGGQYTHYDWQKNIDGTWTSLGAPDDSVLTISNIQLADSGQYRCVATNDWVTDLTLNTETFSVIVEEYPEGQVPDSIEYMALMAIYDSLDGPNWNYQDNWGDSTVSFDEWYGLSTRNGDVIEIDFINLWYSNYVTGRIPELISKLKYLEVLNFGYNSEVSYNLPNSFSQLVNLRVFRIGRGHSEINSNGCEDFFNNISLCESIESLTIMPEFENSQWTISSKIGDLKNLSFLYISGNNIEGALPDEIRNCSKIDTLRIYFTNISKLSNSLYELTQLRELSILRNWNLNEEISPLIGELVNLERLSFQRGFTGTIPESICNLTKLKQLYIYDNPSLSGYIPSNIGNLSQLTILNFENMNLSGEIPHSIGNLQNLGTLVLNRNNLEGVLPNSLSNLSKLSRCELQMNNFTSLMEINEGDLPNLYELNIENCNIESFSIANGALPRLRSLRVSGNPINGVFPSELTNLVNLSNLYARNCGISSLPEEFSNLQNLVTLFIDYNELTLVPPLLQQLPKLRSLYIGNNNIKGPFPENIMQIESLQHFDISNNNFFGVIKDSMLSKNLRSFYIENNNFIEIPTLTNYPFAENLWFTISNNKLGFDSVEKQYDSLGSIKYRYFRYNPQKPFGYPTRVGVSLGQDVTVICEVGGDNNIYQWQRMQDDSTWTDISGANTNQLILTSVALDDFGSYRCEVNNSLVTDLTIYTEPFIVTNDANIVYHAIASGDWNDPNIWSDIAGGAPVGRVPQPGDKIYISGYNITISAVTEASDLVLSNKNANTVVSVNSGKLTHYGSIKLEKSPESSYKCKIEVSGTGSLEVKDYSEFPSDPPNNETGIGSMEIGNNFIIE